VLEGATRELTERLPFRWTENPGANLGNLKVRLPPKAPPAAGKAMTREERWLQLAEGPNSRLPKEVVDHVKRHEGRGASERFGLELAHKPGKAAAQGHDYSQAVPKTSVDHRGIEHRFLKERRTGTTISIPSSGPRGTGKLSLPQLPDALPD
jgi:hypothetical protein